MTRFLNHPDLPFHTLLEPAQDSVRHALSLVSSPYALVVHDWCMFGFGTHTSKKDRLQRSHHTDLGYELGTALIVDASDGRPLGPMELRLRTANGILSTRTCEVAMPPAHIDEMLDVMEAARHWKLGKQLIHVLDREADSVGHYRTWHSRGHQFLVRADDIRLVQWRGCEQKLADVVSVLSPDFQDVVDPRQGTESVAVRTGTGRVQVAETEIVLHRPAQKTTGETTSGGHKKKAYVPGPPLTLRLIVTRVVDEQRQILAQWCLLTNLAATTASAATLGRWYAWRWRIESYHKLLKSAGMNAEEWQQETGAAFLRRLCIVVMSCLTVWHLQREEGEAAKQLRKTLIRLSGRQMKHRVEFTAPALLAGLDKLLAIDDLMQEEDLNEILRLARQVLPKLFRSG